MINPASLLFALCINELVHNLFEIWGIGQKIQWLQARIDNKTHGDWLIHIDSKFKTILVHAILLIFCTGVVWLIVSLIQITQSALLWASIVTLLVSYILTIIYVDACHSKIGKILNLYKKV